MQRAQSHQLERDWTPPVERAQSQPLERDGTPPVELAQSQPMERDAAGTVDDIDAVLRQWECEVQCGWKLPGHTPRITEYQVQLQRPEAAGAPCAAPAVCAPPVGGQVRYAANLGQPHAQASLAAQQMTAAVQAAGAAAICSSSDALRAAPSPLGLPHHTPPPRLRPAHQQHPGDRAAATAGNASAAAAAATAAVPPGGVALPAFDVDALVAEWATAATVRAECSREPASAAGPPVAARPLRSPTQHSTAAAASAAPTQPPQRRPHTAFCDAAPAEPLKLFDELAALADAIVDAMVPAAQGRRSARPRASIAQRLASQQDGPLNPEPLPRVAEFGSSDCGISAPPVLASMLVRAIST